MAQPTSSPLSTRGPARQGEESLAHPQAADAALVLSDGTIFWGHAIGARKTVVGEVCFNTSMTGYQEILTDPSYAGQIITFTFPHVGNVGTTPEDLEAATPAALGLVLRQPITAPANWRSAKHLDAWLKSLDLPGITGVDTRRLTRLIRDRGAAPAGALCTGPSLDPDALVAAASAWPGLEGMDLAKVVSCAQNYEWDQTRWQLGAGYGRAAAPRHHVVAMDFGIKRNILRCLASVGCRVTVVPATATAEEILARRPDGVFLSNGPGDPAATGVYAVPTLQSLIRSGVPIFGICLGHQILSLALGGRTRKMPLGHRGANHPVKDLATGKVEITSQNHGFVVIPESLPATVTATHVSLFDGTNEGLCVRDRPIYSVQYHPEASPGPQDSFDLFTRFVQMMDHRA